MNWVYQAWRLARFNRPVGIWLLLWPTLIALWLAAQGHPDPYLIVIFILGVICMLAAGCIINDIADRRFDKQVRRTQHRPLVTGAISLFSAQCLLVAFLGCAFVLVCFTNRLTLFLSFIALGLASFYPLVKRYSHFPQVVLGVAFGFGIPMAYAAQAHTLPLACWLFYWGTLCWTIAYDTLYAMVDREDDIKIGVKSTAILFGHHDRKWVALCHLLTLCLWFLVGKILHLGFFYWGGLSMGAFLMGYQLRLIHGRNKQACFKAFINNQWVGAWVFLGVVLDFMRPLYPW